MADASTFRAATGWEPEIDFVEGVERVCAPSHEVDTPETNETGRDRRGTRGRSDRFRSPQSIVHPACRDRDYCE